MVYVTGDKHREFSSVRQFCEDNDTTLEDIIIILGDAGINYYGDDSDRQLKCELSCISCTFFMIHGNHEEDPTETGLYEEVVWNGATAYMEASYPNLIFAKDGEIYDLCGYKALVIGGAYSVDKHYRLSHGLPWFESEQPGDATRAYVEEQLERVNWEVDIVLSHTVPIGFEPTWAFIPGYGQDNIDKSTERWLQTIYEGIDIRLWLAGHYHVQHQEDNLRIMYEDIEPLEELL